MQHRSFRTLVFAALLVACSEPQLSGLRPVLSVVGTTPVSSGHYVLNFGPVPVGSSEPLGLTLTDTGRAVLALAAVETQAPFSASPSAATTIAVKGVSDLVFTFAPTEVGPVSETVILKSDGGTVTVDLVGTGQAIPCAFSVMPSSLAFGNVLPGSTAQLGVHVQNTGTNPCDVTAVQLTSGTPAAFSLAPNQATSGTITAMGEMTLAVVFAPTEPATNFTGSLSFNIGPPDQTVTVPITGASPACVFTVTPSSINFGNVDPGQTKTSTVTVANTGTGNCPVSAIGLDPTSNSAFSLVTTPAATTLTMGRSLPVDVKFAPTAMGASFTGTLDLTVGTTPQTVPLTATATLPCVFTVTPATVNFGYVASGQSRTSTATITNTGQGTCDVTSVALATSSSGAFSIVTTPPATTLTASQTLPIELKFAPTQTMSSFTGTLDVEVSSVQKTVTLLATSVYVCPDPLSNGVCPVASAPIYLTDSTSLYTFNLMTHDAIEVGSFPGGASAMYDIAINTEGTLVGISEGGLYAINPTTAACNLIGSADSAANGATFLLDGTLVIAGSDVELYDGTTWMYSRTLVPAGRYQTSGDIVASPDGSLYWSVQQGGNDGLVRIDPSTGGLTLVGTLGASGVWGLAYAADTLYGYTSDGQYLIIDPTTAASTVGSTPGSWYGATTNPAWQ